MPGIIPEWNEQRTLQPGMTAGMRDPKLAGQIGENIKDVGKMISQAAVTIEDITDRFQALKDKKETTQAEIDLTRNFNRIYEDSLKAEDPFKAESDLRDKYQRAVDDSSRSITSNKARDDFKSLASLESERHFFTTSGALKNKQVKVSRAESLNKIDQASQEYAISTSPSDRQVLREKIEREYQDAVRLGYMDATSAVEHRKKTLENLDVNRALKNFTLASQNEDSRLIEQSFNNIISDIQKGEYQVSDAKKMQLVREASSAKNAAIGVNKIVTQEKKNNFRFEFLNSMANDPNGFEMAKSNIAKIAPQDPELAEAVQNVAQYGGVYTPTKLDDMAFADVVRQVYATSDNTELGNFMVSTLKKISAGNVSRERLPLLVSLARERAIANKATSKEDMAIKSDVSETAKFISNMAANFPYNSSDITIEFLKRKQAKNLSGDELKAEGRKVIKDHLSNKYPNIDTLEDTPNKIIDEDGYVQDVYNGGNYLNGELVNDTSRADFEQDQPE